MVFTPHLVNAIVSVRTQLMFKFHIPLMVLALPRNENGQGLVPICNSFHVHPSLTSWVIRNMRGLRRVTIRTTQ